MQTDSLNYLKQKNEVKKNYYKNKGKQNARKI